MKTRNLFILGILAVLLMSTIGYTGTTLVPIEPKNDLAMVAEYTPHAPILIEHDNFTGWPGSGTPESPYIIEGLNITADTPCIIVYNTSSFFVIRDSFFHYTGGLMSGPSIGLYQSNNSLVENCYARSHRYSINVEFSYNSNITGNEVAGIIYARDSPGVRVEDNSITSESPNAIKGISITPGCDNAFVYNNTIDLSENSAIGLTGIEILQNANVTVQGNYVKNVNGRGILVSQCPDAVISDNTLQGCLIGITVEIDAALVENNMAFECETGILLNAHNSTAVNNAVFWNSGIGLLAGAANCTIYNNYIGFNTDDPEQGQAYEASWLNFWDDGVSQGNYWSDYDGVSDNYTVNPGLWWNGVDHYPMIFEESVINNPADLEFESGDAGHELSWTSDGTLPESYELVRDDEVVEIDVWDGSVLTFSLDSLPVGVYHYTLTTHFESRMDASDEVTVTVAVVAGPDIDVEGVVGVTPHVVVEVSATVSDMSGVAEVILSYTLDEIQWTNITMSQSSGQWVAEIPGQPNGTVVGYKVYARDTLDNWAVSSSESFSVIALPTPDMVTLYLIVGAGVAVVVVLAAVFMKRR